MQVRVRAPSPTWVITLEESDLLTVELKSTGYTEENLTVQEPF